MTADGLAQRLTQATEQMPAIGHLHGPWSSAPCSIGIKVGAITRDNLAPRVALQPVGYAVRIAIRPQLQTAIALQIADDRSPPLPAPPRTTVDAATPRPREIRDRRRPPHDRSRDGQGRSE